MTKAFSSAAARGAWEGLASAVSFLSPLGAHREVNNAALAWLGPAGAGLGAAVGQVWWAGTKRAGPLFGGALATVADAAFTGALHLDGLADAADGLVPVMDRSRRLEVMADPATGAFGTTALSGTLILRAAALSAVEPDAALLASLWCLSRTLMAGVAQTMTYARPGGGLVSAFLPQNPKTPTAVLPSLLGGGLVSLALARPWRHPLAVVPLIGAVLAGAGVATVARRRIGGFTGDVLGAIGVVAETAGIAIWALVSHRGGK